MIPLKPQCDKIDWSNLALALLADFISAKIHQTGIDISLHYGNR